MEWSLAGLMAPFYTPKTDFNAIFDGTKYVIIGGLDLQNNENCVVNGKNMTCTHQPAEFPAIFRNYDWPVLLLIDLDENKVC